LNLQTLTATGTGGIANLESFVGGDAVDTLTGVNASNSWNLTGADQGTLNGAFAFLSVENLTGGTGADLFTLGAAGAFTGLLNGNTGADTLVGRNVVNVWSVPTANNAGDLNGMPFTGIENLTGGSDADLFVFGASRTVSGIVTGGGGTDTLNAQAYTTALTVNLQSGSATVAAGGIASVESFLGGSAVDTLAGADVNSTWNLLGVNEGALSTGVTFAGFENLTGGIANDTFAFTAGAAVTGTVNGSGGADTVDYSAVTTAVTVNLQTSFPGVETFVGGSAMDTLIGANTSNSWILNGVNTGTINAATNYASFENLTGGTSPDSFVFFPGGSVTGVLNAAGGADSLDYTLQAANVTVNLLAGTASLTGGIAAFENLYGGGGADTLIGANTNQTWTLTATNAGAVGGFTFSAVENLVGGTAVDTFNFTAGFAITGSVTGGDGAPNIRDVITAASSANTWTLSAANAGTAVMAGVGTVNFSQMETLNGGAGLDTLIGDNSTTTWNVGPLNAGSRTGNLSYTGMENLTGGSGNDSFVFANNGGVSGTVDGNGGVNTLDYSAYSAGVTVNLATGVGTGAGSALLGFRDVIGGSGADVLTGDGQANTLTGNIGNDTLIGGAGNDTLSGGQGSNILVGGEGDDNLISGTGRDLLIGGLGVDVLLGGGGDDILIGARTSFDADLVALNAIMNEWRSNNSYTVRIANLMGPTGGLNGTTFFNSSTVFDDGAADTLTGGGGRDWFFFTLGMDLITDPNDGGQETIFSL